jgi:hypothetical protein
VAEHLKRLTSVETVYFVLFDARALATFEKELNAMKERGDLDDPQTPAESS